MMEKKTWLNVWTVVLLACLAGLLLAVHVTEQNNQEEYIEIQREMRALKVEKGKLEQEMAEAMPGSAAITLVFDGAGETLFNTISPAMQKKSYKGTIGISENQFPGNAGCITMEQFRQLLADGWDYCVVPDDTVDSAEDLSAWLTHLRNLQVINEMTGTTSIYFRQGVYKAEYDAVLAQFGYTNVMVMDETHKDAVLECREAIWKLNSYIWNASGVVTQMEKAVAARGATVFEVNIRSGKLDKNLFTSMLDNFSGYTSKGSLLVTSVTEAREHITQQQDTLETLKQEQQARRVETQQRIDEIQQQIDTIYEQYLEEIE